MNEQRRIVQIVELVDGALGHERGVVCARDCLLQWEAGFLDQTISAWERYLQEIKDKDGHSSENRHGAWCPAIPL